MIVQLSLEELVYLRKLGCQLSVTYAQGNDCSDLEVTCIFAVSNSRISSVCLILIQRSHDLSKACSELSIPLPRVEAAATLR